MEVLRIKNGIHRELYVTLEDIRDYISKGNYDNKEYSDIKEKSYAITFYSSFVKVRINDKVHYIDKGSKQVDVEEINNLLDDHIRRENEKDI